VSVVLRDYNHHPLRYTSMVEPTLAHCIVQRPWDDRMYHKQMSLCTIEVVRL